MSARDDFGSDAGRPGGRGGSNGGLANGGVGGGRGGGGGGGGAGRNGGYGSHTGLQTGNKMYGTEARGRPGGKAQNPGAWGIRPGPSIQQSALNRPTVPGLLSPVPAVPQQPVPAPGLSFNYDIPMPAGVYPGNYWGGGALWSNVNSPPAYSPPSYTNPQLPAGYSPGNYWGGTLGGWGKPNGRSSNGSSDNMTSDDNPYGIGKPGGKGNFQGDNFNGNMGYY